MLKYETHRSQADRWTVIGALDIVTEAALFVIPIYVVAALKMSVWLKVVVVCAFGIRLP
jgi:hypothetical protein